MTLISKIALLILIVAILYLSISGNLFSVSPWVIAGQLLAVALAVWARRSFMAGQFSIREEPEEGQLLSKGPYQYIRHPMYAAALLLVWSGILGHVSPITVIVGLITSAVIVIRVLVEEQLLRAHYSDYVEYARRTKRVIPFLI